MITWERGRVLRVLGTAGGLQELEVSCGGREERALNYISLTGEAFPGDEVYLNTSAVRLGLGSGGYHFVIANLTRTPDLPQPPGHIMKLRYTPFQVRVLSAEEEASPCHEAVASFEDLAGCPVVVGTLHSMLAPIVAGCKVSAGDRVRVAYVMTDGAALPLAFSRTVRELKEAGLLVGTVTAGHAFGGDLEAVNIYSGIAAARAALKAEIIVVTMGPGIVGTGTRWGTTALEQGVVVNAVHSLGGCPVAVPRISFADPRPRHRGVSHHTLTALGRVALAPAFVVLPELPPAEQELVWESLAAAGIPGRHRVVVRPGEEALRYLEERGIAVTTMGRGPAEDPAYFLAAGAAGIFAGEILRGGKT